MAKAMLSVDDKVNEDDYDNDIKKEDIINDKYQKDEDKEEKDENDEDNVVDDNDNVVRLVSKK